MSNAIGWYLTELRMLLTPHLTAARVVEICKETRVHLELEAERLGAKLALENEEAAWLAIEAFGEPGRVAQTYVRESGRTVFGLKPLWAIVIGALVAMLCWDFHWLTLQGPFDNYGDTWQNGLVGVLGGLALVLFVMGCRASFRWNGLRLLGLSVATALVLVPVMSVWLVSDSRGAYYRGVSRLHLSRDAQKLKVTLGRLDALETYVREGERAFAQAGSLAELPAQYKELDAATKILGTDAEWSGSVMGAYRHGPSFIPEGGMTEEVQVLAPNRSVFAMVDGRIHALDTTGYSSAKSAWADADFTLQSIEGQRDSLRALLRAVNEASNGRLFFLNPWVTVQTSFWTLSLGALLLLLDLAVWLLVRRRKARPGMALA